ncbi:MAG: virulence factor BrkB family protein [Chromatiales bacterium]|nr:virulence factor BrkB family protein [Chromatiales bacterium]
MSEPESINPPQRPAGARFSVLAHVVRRFFSDDCLSSAAALTYTTLLALVPLMAVTLTSLTAFPVFERFSTEIQEFLFQNFVPASGDVLRDYLQDFVSNAKALTVAGIVFLLVTAVLLMATIDRALSRIFHVHGRRSAVASFLVYWSILSLGPVLMGVSIVVSSYLLATPLVDQAAATIGGRARLLAIAPLVFSTLGFALLYVVVPNRRVPMRHALAGGLVAGLLFELAKRLFGWYVTTFPTYQAIYGALATIPVFLIWVYLSWVIALIGAEFTGALMSRRTGLPNGPPELATALLVLERLHAAQNRGGALTTLELNPQAAVSDADLTEVLARLAAHAWIHRTADERWTLARRLEETPLAELVESLYRPLPDVDRLAGHPLAADAVTHARTAVRDRLSLPVADVLSGVQLGVQSGLSPERDLSTDSASASTSGSSVP